MTVSQHDSTRAQLTERDCRLLAWLARQRIATAADLEARFGVPRSVVYARLRALSQHGLVDRVRIFRAEPGVFWATRDGLRLCGQRGSATRIKLGSYHHDLALTALCAELEAEFGPARVLTERELRAAERESPAPRYAPERGRYGAARHYPDLAVDCFDGDRPLAVELECTRKSAPRLDSIVRSYVRARHIAGVRYYAASPAVERAILSSLTRVRAPAGLVDVRLHRLAGSSPAAALALGAPL